MYEKKNEQLDRDLHRVQQELLRAKQILAQVDSQWKDGVKPDAVREKETERVCGKKRVNAVKLFLRP
jgi:cob(I)alamin adenosyltransferase